MSSRTLAVLLVALAGCPSRRTTMPREVPTPTVQVGSCGQPGKDGVMGSSPKIDRADRDLNGDGIAETITVDRAKCDGQGNCYWNVFVMPIAGSTDCARYVGTFQGTALETLPGSGEDNMRDIRAYWNQSGGRMRLESYQFARGGYRIVDSLMCRRANDDKLECMDEQR